MSKMYLVQRCFFNNLNNTAKFSGREGLFNLDYMGYSEYEWGALPKSLSRLVKNFTEGNISAYITDITNPCGTPLIIFCHADYYEEALNQIKLYLEDKSHRDRISQYRTKGWNHFAERAFGDDEIADRYKNKCPVENCWWDIDNDVIFFFGATDRINALITSFENESKRDWWRSYFETKT